MNEISVKPQINIKWSYGEPYEKSSVKKENVFKYKNNQNSEIKNFAIGENNQKQLEREFACSIEHPQLLHENIAKDSFQKKENKREDSNNKMLERAMITQTSQNPFMSNNNYIDDLTVQDEFLKPKNSNYEINQKN